MIKTRLLALLSEGKKYIIYQVLWQWAVLLGQIISVFAIGNLVQKILEGRGNKEIVFLTLWILILMTALRFLADQMAARMSYAASAGVKRILRDKIYEKLLKLGASYRERISSAEAVQMSVEGVEQLETYFGRYLPQLFYSILAPVTLFFCLKPISLKASAVLLICVPLIPISIVAVQKIAKRLLQRYWGMYTQLGDSFLENLQGMTTLKIYQADEQKAAEMDEEASRFRKITMKVLTMQLNSTSVMDIIAYGGAAAGMILAVREFMAGNVSFGGALVIILLAAEFFIPLRLLGSFFHIAMNGMAASDKIFALLDQEEPRQGTEDFPEDDFGIHIKNVSFSYDGKRQILKDISMEFPSGSFISLVGESGCGKSTIAGILAGKNKNDQGEVCIGQTPLENIREEERMKHITLVTHNSYLFQGTVEENLRMAKPDAELSEMREALQAVNLLDFLNDQDGLQTKLTEKAENFSGGQRQRLALARALLHDTPIYIFDEAASNIDAESEEMIMDVIRKLAETKTVLLISHRLSNVTECDRIYMMEGGQIKEQGTHDQLISREGKYKMLYQEQRELEQYVRIPDAGEEAQDASQ
ncbi:ABC transporter ATP-binding protein/permease [Anaerostipes butyraticus]|uniref:ABC transporter ATP-binding protein n=1 Tax=Anaerostipes butyraticus TaxID=645466 RepID=A0A916VCP4_9FIRM|nr:ABC transporter ATP-binding protein/permease [Anaerostipes butyraticus]GFO85434.1 putative ABC transporter ATP-binding protein [Anaerostipes butyraticus]HJC81669.1 ABC transporter ATP-binding protein/permease [Candidatus Anaerostipes avicola]